MDYHIGTGQTYASIQAAIPDVITNVDLTPSFILHGDSSSPIPGGCVIDWTVLDPMVFTYGITITIINYQGGQTPDTPVIDGQNTDTAGIVINLNNWTNEAIVHCSNIEIKNINGDGLIINTYDASTCNNMKVHDNVGGFSVVGSNSMVDLVCNGNQFYNCQGGFNFSSPAAGSCNGNKIYNCAFASITFAGGAGRGLSIDGNLIFNTGGINMGSGAGTFPNDVCNGTNTTYFNPGADNVFAVGGANAFFAVINNTYAKIVTEFSIVADKVKYNVLDTATFTGSITSVLAITGANVLVEVVLKSGGTPTTIFSGTTDFVANTPKALSTIAGHALTWTMPDGNEYIVRLKVSGGFPAVDNPTFVDNIIEVGIAGVVASSGSNLFIVNGE